MATTTTTLQEAIDGGESDTDLGAPEGTKVDVYWNFHDNIWSIRSRETESYGLVIDHQERVVVEDVEFVVSEKRRQDVLEEGVKNVHAVVRGVIGENAEPDESWTDITYNPFKYSNFVTVEDEDPIHEADVVVLSEDGVFATGI